MNIVIYGTGGVGGYFGARLAQAGHDVTFIARGKHLKAIQKDGLQLKSVKGDYKVTPAKATDNVLSIKAPDVIFFATKTWQLKEAAKTVVPILSDHTMVIPLLNGVTNIDDLLFSIPKKNVVAGFCKIFSKIENPGIIHHVSMEPYIAFGELDNSQTDRVLELQKAFQEAEVYAEVPEDIHHAIWSKYLFITIVSALGALTRATLGEMRTAPETREIMLAIAKEVVAIANAKGVKMDKSDIQKAFQFIDKVPFEATASLQRDVMEGRPSELESQVGTIHKLGLEFGISTPASTFVYHSLLIQEKRHRENS